MNFNGDGYVELRSPSDMEDLRAYTSLSLSLQRPKSGDSGRGDDLRRRRQVPDTGNMFVLYLGNKNVSSLLLSCVFAAFSLNSVLILLHKLTMQGYLLNQVFQCTPPPPQSTKNYMGMFMRNNQLVYIYKLNDRVHEIKSFSITESDSELATFDKIDLRRYLMAPVSPCKVTLLILCDTDLFSLSYFFPRIYEDAQLSITKPSKPNSPEPPVSVTENGDPSHNLFDVDPSDVVFYVGGYPDDFKVCILCILLLLLCTPFGLPICNKNSRDKSTVCEMRNRVSDISKYFLQPPEVLHLPKYQGCIELSTFNEKFISLYNFKNAFRVNQKAPCKR